MTTCEKAVSVFGEEHQLDIAQEEMAELILAISHHRRGRDHNVEEEIADVKIMIEQLEVIFDAGTVEEIKKQKLARLDDRVDNYWRNNQ